MKVKIQKQTEKTADKFPKKISLCVFVCVYVCSYGCIHIGLWNCKREREQTKQFSVRKN